MFAPLTPVSRDRGQGLVEYGLIIALVAVVAIAGLIIFGPAVASLLSKLGGSVQKNTSATAQLASPECFRGRLFCVPKGFRLLAHLTRASRKVLT